MRPRYGHRHPPGTWQTAANRHAALLHLGRRLGFREPGDWYRLTRRAFLEHGLSGLLQVYDGSVVDAVRDLHPEVEWKEWLFSRSPRGFWSEPGNLRRWIRWFAERERLEGPEDWYRLTTADFKAHRGGHSVLAAFGSSVVAIAAFAHPGHVWLEWRFPRVANDFWDAPGNRRRYVEWLVDELGLQTRGELLAITQEQIESHHGGGLLARYGGSPAALLTDTVLSPETPRWVFHQVGRGFWDDRSHRIDYLRWLGSRLRFETADDWARLRRSHLKAHHGSGLLQRYPRFHQLLEDLMEDLVEKVGTPLDGSVDSLR